MEISPGFAFSLIIVRDFEGIISAVLELLSTPRKPTGPRYTRVLVRMTGDVTWVGFVDLKLTV
jgi:hypothetical protein